jgi:hypothetical protein
LLTPRFVLVLNTAHGLLWSARGMVMGNIFMLVRVSCSSCLYILVDQRSKQINIGSI